MKYVSILIPEAGPFGDTFFEARARAISGALFVNNPCGGCVESVFTFRTHRRLLPPECFLAAALDLARDFFAGRLAPADRFFAALFFSAISAS